MERKTKRGLIWLIVILISLVLGLLAYIVYDKVILENNLNEENKITEEILNTTNKNDNNYDILWTGTAFDLLEKANIDECSNFQNKQLKIGKINFTLNCIGYNIVGGNACDLVEILINDKSNDIKSSVEIENDLIVADDIVVVTGFGSDEGIMKVISEKGDVIFEKEIIVTYSNDNKRINDGTPKLLDGKLYFYTKKDEITLYKNYLDLNNNFNLVVEEEIEGYIGEY